MIFCSNTFEIFPPAVTGMTITIARGQVVSFLQPIVSVSHGLFIKNPTGDFNYLAYIEPLKNIAWLFIGLYWIITPVFLYLTTL